MSRLFQHARENGWPATVARVLGGATRRLRDHLTAGKLGTTGFHLGKHPRLLGLSHMHIGKNFHAGDDVWLEAVTAYAGEAFTPQILIGDNVNFSDRVHIACIYGISIGAGTLIGSRVIVSDHGHGKYRGEGQDSPASIPAQRRLHSPAAVVIGRNVWLGDGVAVLAGAHIGDGAIIGANAVVTGTIPAQTIAVGTPARPIRQWNEEAKQWLPLN